jgi:hypothetical protein
MPIRHETKAQAHGVLDLRHLPGHECHTFVLPEGLTVSRIKDGNVCDFGHFWLDDYRDVIPSHLHHDAEYRGIVIKAMDVRVAA